MTLNLPNALSLLRMGLIPLFIIWITEGAPGRALAVFLVAGITDALDGFIARFFDQTSVLGAYLDPIADKLLLISAYVVLAVPGLHAGVTVPLWITILVIARDVLILVIALVLYLAAGISRFKPTGLSKVNTAAQIVTVILVLLTALVPHLDRVAVLSLYVVAALTGLSGIDYLRLAGRMSGGTGNGSD